MTPPPALLAVPCPRCAVPVGELCKSVNGHRTTLHSARVTVLIQRRRQYEAQQGEG